MEDKQYLYKGFHSVERLETVIKGEKRVYEKLGIKSYVTALMTDAAGKIGLVSEYRPCIGEVVYDVPGGFLDKDGLTKREVLAEELQEECEINPADIEFLSKEPFQTHYVFCGSSDAQEFMYRVKLNIIQQSRDVDDCDVERVEWLTFGEFEKMARSGVLKSPSAMLAYMYLKEELASEEK